VFKIGLQKSKDYQDCPKSCCLNFKGMRLARLKMDESMLNEYLLHNILSTFVFNNIEHKRTYPWQLLYGRKSRDWNFRNSLQHSMNFKAIFKALSATGQVFFVATDLVSPRFLC